MTVSCLSLSQASPQQGAATTTDNQQDAGEQCSVSYRGQTVTVPKGTVIRTALLQNGLTPHNGRSQVINCRGLGTCGTCAVEVRQVKQLIATQRAELLLRMYTTCSVATVHSDTRSL